LKLCKIDQSKKLKQLYVLEFITGNKNYNLRHSTNHENVYDLTTRPTEYFLETNPHSG